MLHRPPGFVSIVLRGDGGRLPEPVITQEHQGLEELSPTHQEYVPHSLQLYKNLELKMVKIFQLIKKTTKLNNSNKTKITTQQQHY